MKTSPKLIVTSSLAVALAAVALVPMRSFADGPKGGAQALMMKPIVVSSATATPHKMSCASCTETLVSYNDSGKPSVKDIRTVSMDSCSGCSSHITAIGFGKGKANAISHSCSFDTTNLCCK